VLAADAIVSAAVGRLVIVGVIARTAPRAVEMLLESLGPDRRALATVFKVACSWRAFHRSGGDRVVITDSLTASDSIRRLIAAGDIEGLYVRQVAGAEGVRTIDAALASAVGEGRVSLREAAGSAVNRKTLIALVRHRARERRAARRGTEQPGASARQALTGS
jgi:Tfp pilus assembly pilus retraction ATPase PilT